MYPTQYARTIEYLAEKRPLYPLLVYGITGIGKTSIPGQVYKKLAQKYGADKFGFLYVNMTACEPSDLLGNPIIMEKKDGSKMTTYAPPDWLKRVEDFERGIAIFDEVNRLDYQVQNTYMQFLDRRELGNVRVPDGWLIVQTANPNDEGYKVSDLDKALLRRSVIIQLQFSLDEWREWAMGEYLSPTGNRMHPRVLAATTRVVRKYDQEVKNKFDQVMSPYGWEICSEYLWSGAMDELNREIRTQIMAGAAGPEYANLLESSLNDEEIRKLLKDILDSKQVTVPKGKEDMFIDLMYMFFESLDKEPKRHAKPALALFESLPGEFRPVYVKYLYKYFSRFKKEYEPLKLSWRGWCSKNKQYESILLGGGNDE
jgi:hypothetical protein